jgi:hypothetical protein
MSLTDNGKPHGGAGDTDGGILEENPRRSLREEVTAPNRVARI